MGSETGISWTDSTFNPVRGCQYAVLNNGDTSRACLSPCYAEVWSRRNPGVLGVWGPDGTRPMAGEAYWKHPATWQKAAAASGTVKRVFCASLADIFEGDTDPCCAISDCRQCWGRGFVERRGGPRADYEPMLARLWATIRATPNLRWQLLTKRPWNMLEWAKANGWPDNAWAGVTAEGQRELDERLDWLEAVPARVRFLSIEPMFEPMSLRAVSAGVSWVIVGGNSGGGAELLDLGAVRCVVRECDDTGKAVFVKQLGSAWARRLGCATKGASDPAKWPEDLRRQDFPRD